MEHSNIIWDMGTAYDFFISLRVLHRPGECDVRPSWTAGVRARLSIKDRQVLELYNKGAFDIIPFSFIFNLKDPKNGKCIIETLSRLSPRERLKHLFSYHDFTPTMKSIIEEIEQKGNWEEDHRTQFQKEVQHFFKVKNIKNILKRCTSAEVRNAFEIWKNPDDMGEKLFTALKKYYELFFSEEEKRITKTLEVSLKNARNISYGDSPSKLLEVLSGGVVFPELENYETVIFAPSFWAAPLLYFGAVEEQKKIYVYGARPPHTSLIPGNSVPEDMVRTLKALSDPTRLNILKFISERPMTPAQLAKRLSLRAPTITHHLKILRLARLVKITFNTLNAKETKHYETRKREANESLFSIGDFIGIMPPGSKSVDS